jgi:RecA-family ATPase
MTPVNGPVIVVSAEEEIDELHRRLADISVALGNKLEDLRDLHLIDLAGKDAAMAASNGRTSIIKPTGLWRGLASMVTDIRPKLVVLDSAADIYAGNENIRPEVRQFIGILRGLAIDHDLAVALSSHPSLTGLSTGSGTSGSTGWNNSARARLYLERFKDGESKEPGPDLRILRVMKANYGPAGQELRLRWSNGCFVLDGQTGSLDKFATDAKAERVFLALLTTYHDQGRTVSHNQVTAMRLPSSETTTTPKA